MTSKERNKLGYIGWSALAFVIGIIVLLPMIGRETYQYYTYLKPNRKGFEWEDAIAYGMLILVFSWFHYFVTDYFSFPVWTKF